MADAHPATQAVEEQAGDGVEVDIENDSTYGDDFISETTSLSSSIFQHRFENGRRYHAYKAGKYILPNDEQELDRLDVHHHIALLHLDGELYLAPIGERPSRILDLGTGTGIWAIDMGDKFEDATVIGVDLSPVQPSWVPPKVKFEIDDIEEEWNFREPFDFIHSRYMAGSIHNWDKYIKQCFDNLKPGAWAEFKDWDARPYTPEGSLELPDNTIKKWHAIAIDACEYKVGASPNPGIFLKQKFAEAGFINIAEKVFEVPVGSWPKDPKKKLVGKYYGVTFFEGAQAVSTRLFTHFLNWDMKEVEVFNAKFRENVKTFQFYHKYHIVYGQKPPTPESSAGVS